MFSSKSPSVDGFVHQPGRVLVHFGTQVVDVDVPACVRLHVGQLVAGHRHARGIRPVCRVGDDDLPPLRVLASVGEVGVHEHQTGDLALRACSRLKRDGVQSRHFGEDLLEPPHQLEGALRSVLLLQRMQMREAGQGDEPLVDARVVFHGARAERVEARVDSEVARRQFGEVAEDLRLGELGQARRLGAAQLLRQVDTRQAVVAGRFAAATSRLRLLEDQLHAATSAKTSAKRSTSAGVRFSVTHTSRASSSPA